MTKLQVDYDSHPAFRDASKPWELSEELIATFSSFYAFAHAHGRSLPGSARKEAEARCGVALADIFSALLTQARNEREEMFLNELSQHLRRLLHDDMLHSFRDIGGKISHKVENGQTLDRAIELSDQGYLTGRLDPNAVARLMAVAEPIVAQFRIAAQNGKTSRDDLATGSGVIVPPLVRIINEEFDRLGINSAVSMYKGEPMHVGGLALELSVPAATWWRSGYDQLPRDPQTLYFHIDESPAKPKAIVYLTDVSLQNGPTGVAPRALADVAPSPLQLLVGRIIGQVGRDETTPLAAQYRHSYHRIFGCPVFRSDFMKLPAAMRWNSHFGWDVIPDSEVETRLVACEKKIVGPAGTFLVFDGHTLLHRGGLVEQGERVAMQVIFDPKVTTTFAQRSGDRVRALPARVRRKLRNVATRWRH